MKSFAVERVASRDLISLPLLLAPARALLRVGKKEKAQIRFGENFGSDVPAFHDQSTKIVLSRNLPEAFRDCQVQRLAPFFRAQRDTLISIGARDAPQVVLLTPGPLNETYFEHA